MVPSGEVTERSRSLTRRGADWLATEEPFRSFQANVASSPDPELTSNVYVNPCPGKISLE